MSSGSRKNLKLWGKVVQALQKALQEQETWKSAQNCLRVTPQLGVGAATQTFTEETFTEDCRSIKECNLNVNDSVQLVDKVNSAKGRDSEEQRLSPKPSSSGSPAEGKRQAQSFWDGLAEEARNAAKNSATELLLENVGEKPPPCAAQDCTESLGEGRNAVGLNKEYLLDNGDAENKEGLLDSMPVASENKESLFDNADECEQEKGGKLRGGIKANQNACQKTHFFKEHSFKGRSSHSRRQGEPRRKERPSPERKGRGRSPTKKLWSPEAASQSTSGSESDSISDYWDSGSCAADCGSDKEEVTVYKISNNNVSTWVEGKSEKE